MQRGQERLHEVAAEQWAADESQRDQAAQRLADETNHLIDLTV
jgi:hypothetical protein